ncbi:GTPase HflX [Caloramator mitchellensis]|uniref:GTPase HflX n=1 Tax=Caloramator mitchellensis TaxID=908809 RepID=A0A0R3JV95_CALMK|nr:GTPase HflX [Caloramator mitchellensis]KRQ87488.1 GTPase HflX [Caloramator mitchellensis]
MLRGDLEGVKKLFIKELEELFEADVDKNIIITEEIVNIISRISWELKREISIYINRRGKIVDIAIGDNNTVSLEEVFERRGEFGLSGVRCIHTHPGGGGELSIVDITALVSLKFDMMVAIGVNEGKPTEFSLGVIKVEEGKLSKKAEELGPLNIKEITKLNAIEIIHDVEKDLKDKVHVVDENRKERAILVAIGNDDLYSLEESLDELEELVETAGAEVVYKISQKKGKIDPATYIGSGKAKEISLLRQSLMADSVIFDDQLSPAQIRNLEEIFGCKVIDRTALILDIFAQRAISREGKIQVELAQLKYRLPRLTGFGAMLSRTGGGIGTRGPGEKKLEIDKRHIMRRINDLEKELESVRGTRQLQRERRISNEVPVVSIVGYTNAGKSTLRNKLCEIAGVDKEKVLEANMLFATLDTTTRLINLPNGKTALVSDTVGFIRKLPHELVEAFKSTLEEILYSDLILHVVDASNNNALAQIEVVNGVLDEIGAGDKKAILVLNKIDLASTENIEVIRNKHKESIEISALNEINLDGLLKAVQENVFTNMIRAKLFIPYSDSKIVSYLHDNNCVENEEYAEDGFLVQVYTTEDVIGRVKGYVREYIN